MKINKLSVKQVENAKATLGDGGGLYLRVTKESNRKWVFRFTLHGKVNEMGLGGSIVSLAVARKKAAAARELVALGIDPVGEKRKERGPKPKKPFGQIALTEIKRKQSESRNEKHRQQWRVTLETYAAPLWGMPVDQVDTEAVLAVLQPIWQRLPETASRLRGRIEAVLDAARAAGHIGRNEANPARWKGHLDKLLSKRKAESRGHHAAMDYAAVPEFTGRLRENETMPSLALEFLILTAARSGEVLGARWNEIDRESKVWTVPAARMKAGREHRVPLSCRALAIVERLAEVRTSDFVFPGLGRNGRLSNGALAVLVPGGASAHGFRSSFRDWCGNETNFPREIAEAALAHVAGNATERAYRRGDALEKRRVLMETWAAFCGPEAGANVVQLRPAV